METKQCSKCGDVKEIGEFHKDRTRKDGLRSGCIACVKAAKPSKKDAERRGLEKLKEKERLGRLGLKRCWGCKQELSEERFGNDKSKKDGKSGRCLSCNRNSRRDPACQKIKRERIELLDKDLKRCSKCGEVLNLKLFNKKSSSKVGYSCECKRCRKKMAAASYLRNKQHVNERGAAYYTEYKEKLQLKARRYSKKLATRTPVSSLHPVIRVQDGGRILNSGEVVVKCKLCKKEFSPTEAALHSRLLAIDGRSAGEANFYCSDHCKQKCPLFNHRSDSIDPRSKLYVPKSEQQKARACQSSVLQRIQCDETGGQSYCERCGDFTQVDLHHTLPVAKHGASAVNPAGHILLCAGCHTELHKECA